MRYKIACVVFLAAATYGVAGQFEIARHTVDSGGGMRSTGGEFELSGTIGQHDAGYLYGGDVELSGGFWFALEPTDCNDDGAVSLTDAADLTLCMAGPDSPVDQACQCFDVDSSGAVDLADFAAAQREFDGE